MFAFVYIQESPSGLICRDYDRDINNYTHLINAIKDGPTVMYFRASPQV